MLQTLAMMAVPTMPVLIVLSQVIPDKGAQLGTDLGAFGVLAWALWYLLARAIPRQRAELLALQNDQRSEFTSSLDKVCERHDGWEKQRHKDSIALNETLDALRDGCYETRMQFSERVAERSERAAERDERAAERTK